MQEEVENRTLTLVVSGTKFTGRMFKAAISKYMAHRKEKKLQKQRSRDAPVIPHGKQTVKQLVGQNQGISNIEITDSSIREFEKIARKYGVDYAVKKDRSSSPPKYLIFFKGRDADALTAAFTEYTNKKGQEGRENETPVFSSRYGWAMVNAIEGELLFASGMRLSLADTAEVYVLPPAFATPGAAVTMPLRRDELTGYDCVWVEPISMDAALRDELRGWYHIKRRFVENEVGQRFYFDFYGAKWLAFTNGLGNI